MWCWRGASLAEIKEISEYCPVELGPSMRGAMCVSYSGRCLLSNYMTDRDANQRRVRAGVQVEI